jgi:tRNA-(ms[2]io[6]A)-hydroxylase
MDEVLLDHAHCEKKAASTALNLIFRYQYRSDLMVPLSEIAREELGHFELVLKVLKSRDIPFDRQKPSRYAPKLFSIIRSQEPDHFVDTMICCALIEARSCERMKLLAESLPDAKLAALYRGLLTSEARHHQTYLDLAATQVPEEQVYERLLVLSAHEAEVLSVPGEDVRMHS